MGINCWLSEDSQPHVWMGHVSYHSCSHHPNFQSLLLTIFYYFPPVKERRVGIANRQLGKALRVQSGEREVSRRSAEKGIAGCWASVGS